ncbi:uncharacterized protein LOC122367622 isoform X6 [Amphibalanus amphitrite]|uniref:uncharacterized protein LOC122367622 isoform X6 n=1 Tax=Amphibalanus amphitrite TaxID=1232801 RepID=UPI001C90A643|nr:uncharacterized protein LOC122367622 isoform X6 [Amphibalanus amphitrite]
MYAARAMANFKNEKQGQSKNRKHTEENKTGYTSNARPSNQPKSDLFSQYDSERSDTHNPVVCRSSDVIISDNYRKGGNTTLAALSSKAKLDYTSSSPYDVASSGDELQTETDEHTDDELTQRMLTEGIIFSETDEDVTQSELQGTSAHTPELPEVTFIDSDHCEPVDVPEEGLKTSANTDGRTGSKRGPPPPVPPKPRVPYRHDHDQVYGIPSNDTKSSTEVSYTDERRLASLDSPSRLQSQDDFQQPTHHSQLPHPFTEFSFLPTQSPTHPLTIEGSDSQGHIVGRPYNCQSRVANFTASVPGQLGFSCQGEDTGDAGQAVPAREGVEEGGKPGDRPVVGGDGGKTFSDLVRRFEEQEVEDLDRRAETVLRETSDIEYGEGKDFSRRGERKRHFTEESLGATQFGASANQERSLGKQSSFDESLGQRSSKAMEIEPGHVKSAKSSILSSVKSYTKTSTETTSKTMTKKTLTSETNSMMPPADQDGEASTGDVDQNGTLFMKVRATTPTGKTAEKTSRGGPTVLTSSGVTGAGFGGNSAKDIESSCEVMSSSHVKSYASSDVKTSGIGATSTASGFKSTPSKTTTPTSGTTYSQAVSTSATTHTPSYPKPTAPKGGAGDAASTTSDDPAKTAEEVLQDIRRNLDEVATGSVLVRSEEEALRREMRKLESASSSLKVTEMLDMMEEKKREEMSTKQTKNEETKMSPASGQKTTSEKDATSKTLEERNSRGEVTDNTSEGAAPWRGKTAAGRKRHRSQSAATNTTTVDAMGLEPPVSSTTGSSAPPAPPAPPRRSQGVCGSPPRAPAWFEGTGAADAAAGEAAGKSAGYTANTAPSWSSSAPVTSQHTWTPPSTSKPLPTTTPPSHFTSSGAPPDSFSPPPPPPPPPPARCGSLGFSTRPRSNSVPGLAQPPDVPDQERPESVWDYTETGGWRRPGRWPSSHSVRSGQEECVDTLRYWYPEAFVTRRSRSGDLHRSRERLPAWDADLDQLTDALTERRLKNHLLGQWLAAGDAPDSRPDSRLSAGRSLVSGRSRSLWDLSDLGGRDETPNPNLTRLLDQEMKEAFFEEALLELMERRRRPATWGGSQPTPARSLSLADLCRPPRFDEVDTHIYDYERAQPYRSVPVQSKTDEEKNRYEHAGRVDSFLPPDGAPTYAARLRCRRAEPPSGDTPLAEQIYSEYQEKLVERMDRKANGSLRLNKPKNELPPEPREIGVEQQVRQEFLGRVQERKEKYGADWDPKDQDQDPHRRRGKDEERPEFTIEGTAEGISEAIADDVKYLLQHDAIWRPGSAPPPVTSSGQNTNYSKEPKPSDFANESVWTPKGLQSPGSTRKEFRPVAYDSDSLKRQRKQQQQLAPKPETSPSETFAWTSSEPPILTPAGNNGNYEFDGVRPAAPPRGQAGPGSQVGRPIQPIRGAKFVPLDDTPPLAGPNDKLYTIKREYETQTEEGQTRKFADLSPRPIHGVGPRTQQGMPVALKSAVKEEHQPEWYRLMYESLHRTKPGRYNYQGGGYSSEPEGGYESDGGRRGVFGRNADQTDDSFRPSSVQKKPLYRNQPGRIEDYLPGHSSLAEREAREDFLHAVTDTTDSSSPLYRDTAVKSPVVVQRSQLHHRPPRRRAAGRAAVAAAHPRSFTRAVLDGYDSDSNLVFKRREVQPDPPPAEQQRSLYSQIQRGGDVPVGGLRKPAPQKPAEPVIGSIPKSMSTSAISERRAFSPQRGRRGDERDAGDDWRAPPAVCAEQLLEEERRRRHLQERNDIERRRHGDNFTPSQKSPIPLNRYDNLFDDVTIRSSRGGEARLAARALHGFKPINNRELCFNKGDIIFIRRQVDRNWLEGELNGRIGIFPVNYVQVVPLDSQRGGRPKLGAEGQARARYSFTAQTPVELSLKKGDLVTLLRRVDSNWYEGRLGNRTGIFPTTYVEVLGRPLPERIESSAKSPGGGMTGGATSAPGGGLQNQLHVDTTQQEAVPYKALYSYQPQNDDELALTEGDVVYVIEKCEDGWYVGTNGRSAMFGTFPGNYVQRVQ